MDRADNRLRPAEVLVDVLDMLGGNPDDEDDDPAGQCDEDGVNTAFADACGGGPGCLISDPDLEHDGREEEAAL